jgi:hypothetical protein
MTEGFFAMATTSVSFGFFFLALPLLGVLAVVIALVVIPKTRKVGLALLGTGGLLLLSMMAIFWFRFSYQMESSRATATVEMSKYSEISHHGPGSVPDVPKGIPRSEFARPASATATHQTVPEPSTILFLLVLLLIGGIAGVVAMIASPKTRIFGIVLLSLGGLVVLMLLVFGLFWFWASTPDAAVPARIYTGSNHPPARDIKPAFNEVVRTRTYAKIGPSHTNSKKTEADLLEDAKRATSTVPLPEPPKIAETESPASDDPFFPTIPPPEVPKKAEEKVEEPAKPAATPAAPTSEAPKKAEEKMEEPTKSATDSPAPLPEAPKIAEAESPEAAKPAAPPAVPLPEAPKKAEDKKEEAAKTGPASPAPAPEAPKKASSEPIEPAKPDKPANARPAWVEASPQLVGDVYQMSISVAPYTTRKECDDHLPAALKEAVQNYIETCLGTPPEEEITLPHDVLQRIVKEKWVEMRKYDVGPMMHLHVLLQFDRKVKDQILAEHKNSIVVQRLANAGIGLGAVLAMIAGAYVSLKMAGGRKEGRGVAE